MRSRTIAAAIVVLTQLAPVWVGAQSTYGPQARVAHLAGELDAIRQASDKELGTARDFIDVMARNACTSGFSRLRASCLIEAARGKCGRLAGTEARQRCLGYTDVLIVNKLSEKAFVSVAERFRLMRNNRSYRRALRVELRRRRGSIVADFSLWLDGQCETSQTHCLSQAIDGYCREYAEKRELSWHHCAAAVVWLIGTAAHAGLN